MSNPLVKDSEARKDFSRIESFYNFSSINKLIGILNNLSFDLESKSLLSMKTKYDLYLAEEAMLWAEVFRTVVEIKAQLEAKRNPEDSWPKIMNMGEFKVMKVKINGLLLEIQKKILFQEKGPDRTATVNQNEFLTAMDEFRKLNNLRPPARK